MLNENPTSPGSTNNETIFEKSLSTNSHQQVSQFSSSLICGAGTAFPKNRFTQAEITQLLGIENQTVKKLLAAPHIHTRHLYFPAPPTGQSTIPDETHEDLNRKFDDGVRDIGIRAATAALEESQISKSEIDFLICVTSTGFRVPGLSSIISRNLGLRSDLYRLDVVGMGCNAGMSALRTADLLGRSGKKGILLCCEINSAIYVRDDSVRTGIVNSLFGDGAAAIVICDRNYFLNRPFSACQDSSQRRSKKIATEILGFSSFTISEEASAMQFTWDQERKKWSFGLSKRIPFVVGENLRIPVETVLRDHRLEKSKIRHWSIHTGGAAVIEGAKKSLGITEYDVRHTRSVMKDFGNISSGSFLVSHQRLLQEGTVKNKDYGILAAMGPGATLEACLVRYHTLK